MNGQGGRMLVRLARADVAMFRFLLEGYDNLAIATTLDSKIALLRLIYAMESEVDVVAMLRDIQRTVELYWQPWPCKETDSACPEGGAGENNGY